MRPFDIAIAFGQGPVKPVLLEKELTLKQKKEWKLYKNNKNGLEPSFFCLKQRKYLIELEKISKRTDLSKVEKNSLKEKKRQQWQNNGFFALKQLGIQNALAAGYALYKGKTNKVILTGGKTIPAYALQTLSQSRTDNWPSEASLMRDIIIAYYSKLYEKKYNSPIDKVLVLEDDSTNTLENFAFAIKENPQILSSKIKVGVITSDHHLKRVTHIAQIFSVSINKKEQKSAQSLLKELENEKEHITNIIRRNVRYLSSLQTNFFSQSEKRWLLGLSQPQYLTYWLGYLGLIDHPVVIQNALNLLKNDSWISTARVVFQKLGINFDEYKNENLITLSKTNRNKYNFLVENLQKLTTPHLRTLPP